MAYRLKQCPIDPSHRIVPAQEEEHQRSIQQVELVENPFVITEHTAYSIWCKDCGCYHQAPLPKEILKAGLFGPRITSLATYLKGKLHGSYTGIRDFFQDVVGVRVSRGYVAKLLRKSSQAFGSASGELIELLPSQGYLNGDETGHKDNGKRYWIWCFRAASFVVFTIDPSRGTEVQDIRRPFCENGIALWSVLAESRMPIQSRPSCWRKSSKSEPMYPCFISPPVRAREQSCQLEPGGLDGPSAPPRR